MKKEVLVICVFLFLSASALAEEIKMAYHNLPPFIYIQEGKDEPEGPIVRHMAQAAKALGITIKWMGPYPVARAYRTLEVPNSELDGFVPTVKQKEFEEFLYFPNKHLFTCRPSLMVLKESKITNIGTADDIKDLNIAVHVGAPRIPMIKAQEHNSKHPLVELTGVTRVKQGFERLKNKRIDGIHEIQKFTLLFSATVWGMKNEVRIVPLPAEGMPAYATFSKKSPKSSKLKLLLEKYEKHLQDIKFSDTQFENDVIKEIDIAAKLNIK